MSLDSFINYMRNYSLLRIRNKLIDITTADRDSFRYFRCFVLGSGIAYDEKRAIEYREFYLDAYLKEERHLKWMSEHDKKYHAYATRANKYAFLHHPLRDYIAWAFMESSNESNPPTHMEVVFPMVITLRAVGDSDENMPHAPHATSTTSQTLPPQNNNNNTNAACGEMMDGVGMNGETTADANGKVKNVRGDNCDHIEKVMEGVVYLLTGGGQGTCAQFNSRFDLGSAGTQSRIKWGTSISHPTDRISKYIRHAVTSVGIIDWMCISNLVKEWANWTLDVLRGHVILGILVILRREVCDAYTIEGAVATENNGEGLIGICATSSFDIYTGGLEDDRINRPSIMSSGESSMDSTTKDYLVVLNGTQKCEELLCDREYVACNSEYDVDTTLPMVVCDEAPINGNDNNVFASYEVSINDGAAIAYGNDNCGDNLTSIGSCGRTQSRGESGYGENEGNNVMTYAVYIMLDNVSERKSGGITNILRVEIVSIRIMLDDNMRYGYQKGINVEEVILVDGERIPSFDWDGSCNISTYGYRPTGGNVEDTCFGGSVAILNESIDACTWGDDVMDVNVINVINVMSNNISQSTDDYHVDSEDVTGWRVLDNHVDISMEGNEVYTGTSGTNYDTFDRSEKDTNQDTINRVNRVMGIGKQTDIGKTMEQSEESTSKSYGNNGNCSRSFGITFGYDTDSDSRSDVLEKKEGHSTDGRGVLEYNRFRKIRILECGRQKARYVHVS
jgi:hypothetical protein